jgi:hypothetical protein
MRDFLFREAEVRTLCNTLRSGGSVLVFGLRRTGKTWVLEEAARRLAADDAATGGDQTATQRRLQPCLIDVQTLSTPSQLYNAILAALPAGVVARWRRLVLDGRTLPSKLADAIQNRLKKGSFGGASVELDTGLVDYWEPIAAATGQALADADPPVALFIDELPFFIENLLEQGFEKRFAKQVLSTLRAWRGSGTPMAIAGSISLDFLLADLEITSQVMNNVDRLFLYPFQRDEARAMLRRRAETFGLGSWDDACLDAILARIDDLHPFFIDLIARKLSGTDRCDPAYIDRTFARQYWPDLRRTFFPQFQERLAKYFTADERRAAEILLDALARSDAETLSRQAIATLLPDADVAPGPLLDKLQRQEFIHALEPGEYAFALRVLRHWRVDHGA